MENELVISRDERRRLTVGEEMELPKYTSHLINLANHTAGSTRPSEVGEMEEIIREFQEEHPEGTFEDWVEFYSREYNGEMRIEDAAVNTFEMIERFREAIDRITYEMVEEWVENLVLYRSYRGYGAHEVIIRKLGHEFQTNARLAGTSERADGINGFLGDQPICIRSVSHNEGPPMFDDSEIPVVYYEETDNNELRVDISPFTRTLDEF